MEPRPMFGNEDILEMMELEASLRRKNRPITVSVTPIVLTDLLLDTAEHPAQAGVQPTHDGVL